jgi:hypothetical protein
MPSLPPDAIARMAALNEKMAREREARLDREHPWREVTCACGKRGRARAGLRSWCPECGSEVRA